MNVHRGIENLRVGQELEQRSAEIELADRDMCARIVRSVNAEDVINELHDCEATLDELLSCERPDALALGRLILAVRERYAQRLISRARRMGNEERWGA